MSQPKEIYINKNKVGSDHYGYYFYDNNNASFRNPLIKYHHNDVVVKYKRNHGAAIKFVASLVSNPDQDSAQLNKNIRDLLNEIDIE